MTEFKKLSALSEILQEDVATLSASVGTRSPQSPTSECNARSVAPHSDKDPEELHRIFCRIREAAVDGCPRMRKIVLKARESDPNRQIYNENMCSKIEKLFSGFCASWQRLAPEFFAALPEEGTCATEDDVLCRTCDTILDNNFELMTIIEGAALMKKADQIYSKYILDKATAEAWQSRVAQVLSDAVLFESQYRFVISAEEKVGRDTLAEEKRAEKLFILKIMEEQANEKWECELRRRREELEAFKTAAKCITAADEIPPFLFKCIPLTALRMSLVVRLQRLIKALLSAPEDANIRRLRNNNEQFVRDYGHPCLNAFDPATGARCSCSSVVRATEVLWGHMGYTVSYTKVPNRSFEMLRVDRKAHSFLLPCGYSLAAHVYEPLGFEDYSERFLELAEPDAVEHADDWMSWYNMMQRMDAVLKEMLSQSHE